MRRRHAEALGPANNTRLAVTQELVALMYADDPVALGTLVYEDAFLAGLTGRPPMEPRYIWETGALAAHLILLGGQR